MWQLASLLLLVTIWGISGTPVPPGKATVLPWDHQVLHKAPHKALILCSISSEPQSDRRGTMGRSNLIVPKGQLLETSSPHPSTLGRGGGTVMAEYCGDSNEPQGACHEVPTSSLGVGHRVPWVFPLHPLTPLTVKARKLKARTGQQPHCHRAASPPRHVYGDCPASPLHPLNPQPTGGSQGA